MTTYVLIHGGFAGGWIWGDVATRLRKAEHRVFTPTLTGLGERVHLASPHTGLNTHIQDVVNVLIYEDLSELVLLGYSYGGMVATGVAELAAERIAHLVFLDALVPQDGQSAASLLGPETMAFLTGEADVHGDGWRIPPSWIDPRAADAPIAERRRHFNTAQDPRHTPHPLKTFQQPVFLENQVAAKLPRTSIYCRRGMEDVGPLHRPVAHAAGMAKVDENWRYRELDSGHMPMWTHPFELTQFLLEVA